MSKLDIETVTSRSTISEAINAINRSKAQIAFVLDDDCRLKGTVTDGDVRRAILAGSTLNSSVLDCMNDDYIFMTGDYDIQGLINTMRMKSIRQIPILDSQYRIIRLHTLDELLTPTQNNTPVIVMAGGRGERLSPLTERCPKPMLAVGERPILETILERMVLHGFYRFYFSINYLGDQIIDYFGDGNKWGAEIVYVEEDVKLGTAGALGLIDFPENQNVIVLNGDVLSSFEPEKLIEFHQIQRADLTICLKNFEIEIPYGVVNLDGADVKSVTEKPKHIYFVNAGIYVFQSKVFALIKKDECLDMPDFINTLLTNSAVVTGYPIYEYWTDIGHHTEIVKARNDFKMHFPT